MEDVVNVFLCRDGRDIQYSMQEYADSQRLMFKDVKQLRSRSTVTINGGWVTKFVSTASGLDGMHVREISISTRLATGGDVKKLTHMLTMARAGRAGMKAQQDKQESVQPIDRGTLRRAIKLIEQTAQRAVKNDGFENGGFEAVKPRSRVTPTEKPTVSRDKSNHELEEMINSLQSQWDNSRTAILKLNDRLTALQLERLAQSHQDSTPRFRIELDDVGDEPKLWVDGRRLDLLNRLSLNWNTSMRESDLDFMGK